MIRAELAEAEGAVALCRRFVSRKGFDHVVFEELLSIARSRAGVPWAFRRLALMFLEVQVFELAREPQGDFQFACSAIGFSSDDYHPRLAQRPPDCFSLEDLIHRSTQECKLSLARYILTPSETMERILSEVDVSEGAPAELPPEAANWNGAPEYEAAFIAALAGEPHIYWIAPRSSSKINSLLEHPAGTAVLVVKPPGSDWEIELKRAGIRKRPLGALFARDAQPVPLTHRLQGGSPAWMLESEARKAAHFAALYQTVHGTPAPMSRTICLSSVRSVPTASGCCNLVRYFTSADDFGEGYEEMRSEMRRCIAAGPDGEPGVPAGEYGLTAAFLRDMKPCQSIVVGTSSFRIETLWQYLSPEGAALYFSRDLGVAFTRAQARRFADDLMEEILGVYTPPKVLYRSHKQYLRAAFRVAENRAAADGAYARCVREIGKFWGTLLAAGGYTSGESFVERNVGLRSVWKEGRWQVQIIFMDHDCMNLWACGDPVEPAGFLTGARLDERHIFGRMRGHLWLRGTIPSLAEIYQCPPADLAKAEIEIREAMRSAYQATLAAIGSEGKLPGDLSVSSCAQLMDFHARVRRSFQSNASEDEAVKAGSEFFRRYPRLFI